MDFVLHDLATFQEIFQMNLYKIETNYAFGNVKLMIYSVCKIKISG